MAKIDEQLFSDIYFTPEQVIYVHDGETRFGLKQLEVDDAQEFHAALEKAYNGRSSYSMAYGSTMYRVERVATLTGFGNTLAKGVREAVQEQGILGALTGGLKASAAGIAAAVFFGFLAALVCSPKDKS